jgi:hypothetical protein
MGTGAGGVGEPSGVSVGDGGAGGGGAWGGEREYVAYFGLAQSKLRRAYFLAACCCAPVPLVNRPIFVGFICLRRNRIDALQCFKQIAFTRFILTDEGSHAPHVNWPGVQDITVILDPKLNELHVPPLERWLPFLAERAKIISAKVPMAPIRQRCRQKQ